MVQETQTSRSLVSLAPRTRPEALAETPARLHLAQSSFIAQLLATRLDAPVTRRLRRASPERAIQCYRTAAALGTTRTTV